MPVMLHSYNRLLFLLLQREGDVMILHIAGLQISSPRDSETRHVVLCWNSLSLSLSLSLGAVSNSDVGGHGSPLLPVSCSFNDLDFTDF